MPTDSASLLLLQYLGEEQEGTASSVIYLSWLFLSPLRLDIP